MIAGTPDDLFIHPDFQELALYLGPNFNIRWCDAEDDKGHVDAQRYPSNDEFMRNTFVFAYQNIGLMVAGIHRPYISKLLELSGEVVAPTVIDVGAGGGQLGLALHTLGFRVSFADIMGQSWNWLNWRLHYRRLPLSLYVWDAEATKIPLHNFAVCFDVLEHLPQAEQYQLLEKLAKVGEVVLVNLIIEQRQDMHGVHAPVDPAEITDWIKARWGGWAAPYYPDETGEPRQWLLIYGDGVHLRSENQ